MRKITAIEIIKNDMSIREVIESMTPSRIECTKKKKKKIHVTDPN